MRKSLTLLAAVAILIGLVAAPAAADQPTDPTEFTLDFAWDGPDACTGEIIHFETHLEIREHQGHENNLTGIAHATGSTDNGYVLKGVQPVVFANDFTLFATTFSDMWTNPETGDKMHETLVFVEKNGVSHVEKFRARCVGGPTILP
jgi:hypothetical protein